MSAAKTCRLCGALLERVFVDLGMSPISNAFLRGEELEEMEPFFSLRTMVCSRCFLVQLGEFRRPEELFSEDYAYFSSYSDSWLRHAETYAEHIVPRLALDQDKLVVEIASNDGYLLRFFKERGVGVLGIEPAANVAAAAVEAGIPTMTRFFGDDLAGELVAAGTSADLIVGNNVLAHVPQLNDFVAGLRRLLSPQGVITLEFPHLVRLIEGNQFDTIYHEHFSYFSLYTAEQALKAHGLALFDVEELPSHGGSLRVYAQHADTGAYDVVERVRGVRRSEAQFGIDRLETYERFGERVDMAKRRLLRFLIDARDAGRTVVGYGAPAKGNTLLNYCGIGRDFIDYTVDLNPHKQGRYLPGTHIPIRDPDEIRRTQPALVFILPWNLREEVIEQLAFVREWGGRFAARSPSIRIFP